MSNIAIQGAVTGTGVFTLASPATNTDRTLTLPDEAGTVLTRATGSPDNSVVVDASGNVGIGTSSPSDLLDISASVPEFRLTSTSGPYSLVTSNTVGTLQLMADEGNTGASTSMRFRVDGSERARIDSSGNLLVGGTSQNTAGGLVYSKTNAKAWVRFNGSAVTVTASHNVSSVSRAATGQYSFSFASALKDSNWCGVSTTSDTSGAFGVLTWVNGHSTTKGDTYSANYNGSYYNDTAMQVIIFGN